MNWKDVPIPTQMSALPLDKRGYPIPVVILRDNFSLPHFQINDSERTKECISNRLCSICGKALNDGLKLDEAILDRHQCGDQKNFVYAVVYRNGKV